jgi:hypothetical protein
MESFLRPASLTKPDSWITKKLDGKSWTTAFKIGWLDLIPSEKSTRLASDHWRVWQMGAKKLIVVLSLTSLLVGRLSADASIEPGWNWQLLLLGIGGFLFGAAAVVYFRR